MWRTRGLGKGLDVQALANLLGDDLFEAAHDMVGNLLGELLAAVMTQAFRGAVLEEKLGGVNLQNLGQLVYDIRRREGVSALDAVDVVVALVQVDGQVLLGQSPFLAEVTQVGDEGLL